MERARSLLREGHPAASAEALEEARQLARRLEPSPVSEEELALLQASIETLPDAAIQVLRYGPSSPFSALGVERLAARRVLNTVNKWQLLKNYRKLALQLHPDRCDHSLAIEAMQLLNSAYDKLMSAARARDVVAAAPAAQRRGEPRGLTEPTDGDDTSFDRCLVCLCVCVACDDASVCL